jgi:hypothetical protein
MRRHITLAATTMAAAPRTAPRGGNFRSLHPHLQGQHAGVRFVLVDPAHEGRGEPGQEVRGQFVLDLIGEVGFLAVWPKAQRIVLLMLPSGCHAMRRSRSTSVNSVCPWDFIPAFS